MPDPALSSSRGNEASFNDRESLNTIVAACGLKDEVLKVLQRNHYYTLIKSLQKDTSGRKRQLHVNKVL